MAFAVIHTRLPIGLLGVPCTEVCLKGCMVRINLANVPLLRLGTELGRFRRDKIRVIERIILV